MKLNFRKVSVKRPSSGTSVSSAGSEFGSFASLTSQISRTFRKSRRREHRVGFVCSSTRIGTSSEFFVGIRCCKWDNIAPRVAELEMEGSEVLEVKLLEEVKVKSKQHFQLHFEGVNISPVEENLTFEFHHKVDTPKQFRVKLDADRHIGKGNVKILQIENDAKEDTEIGQTNISFIKFDPEILEKQHKAGKVTP